MKLSILFALFLFITSSAFDANGAMRKETFSLAIGDTPVKINVYENDAAKVTFFAPHFNERISRTIAKEIVERNGGRLIEIESVDQKGNAARYLKFALNDKSYVVDPNRIFTENGRACAGFSTEAARAIEQFANALLQIIFASDGKTLRANEKFIVAVHNNVDVDAKNEDVKDRDLTAVAFVRTQGTINFAHGAFEAQADGVFLSNTESDADNFIFLSTPQFVGHFAEFGFNVVVQKASAKTPSKQCTVDDGSLSVFSAQNAIPYVCLEADGISGGVRQKQMFAAVYGLLTKQSAIDLLTATNQK